MAEPISLIALFQDSLSRTARLIVPSLPWSMLFAVSAGFLVWTAGMLPDGGTSFVVFSALTFAALFAHSLFSASMYQAVLTSDGGLFRAAWKLTLAWLLMIVVAMIAATIVLLFFSLIGSSLGVVSGEAGQEITDMTAQMREGGTFWPLFVLFLMTLFVLFWFAVRMMLFASATVIRGQVHVFRSWSWTKGGFRILGPLMIVLIIIPMTVFGMVGVKATNMVFGSVETPLEAGLSTGLFAIILLPSAWLGHGFAASVYARLAPSNPDQSTMPA